MRATLSFYTLKLPIYYIYMLQQVEYDPVKFDKWNSTLIKQGKPIQSVMHRKTLVYTAKAKLLLCASILLVIAISIVCGMLIVSSNILSHQILLALIWLAVLPNYLYLFLLVLTWVAHRMVIRPKQRKLVRDASSIFASHKGVKIAVLGSYGKTTMKDMLATVLSEGLDIAVTPGNMNVSVSHARFAKKLTGSEDCIIVEFGEGETGDIGRMARMLQPDYAIITGLAPNHLDHYADLQAVACDLLDIHTFVDSSNVFASGESAMLSEYLDSGMQKYTATEVLGWKIEDVRASIEGLTFILQKDDKEVHIKSALLGRHQVAPLALVATLAEKLGLEISDIEKGLAKTKPFEHRMQPRLVNGAWLIDDTYNGNLEGLQAGLSLLKELEAKRKWYVTPGLVDQGSETERVHVELGKAIADANPDIVVLMENSVRPVIETAMAENGFKGELRIEKNPLDFYVNIEHVLAAGDLVLMQNDWTDNYS